MGPRSCAVCGPTLTGCRVCRSKLGHRHIQVLDRRGAVVGSVATCDLHAPETPAEPQKPARVAERQAIDPRKRWLDRTYRQAVRELRHNHSAEFVKLLDKARSF